MRAVGDLTQHLHDIVGGNSDEGVKVLLSALMAILTISSRDRQDAQERIHNIAKDLEEQTLRVYDDPDIARAMGQAGRVLQ